MNQDQQYLKIDNNVTTPNDDPMLDDGYTRKFGAYKPKFKGTSPGYYPFEPIDYLYVGIFTFLTWAICVPIWYGLFVAAQGNSFQYGIVCAIVWVGWYTLQTLGVYYGGKMKRVVENEMIASKLKELEEKEREKQKLLHAI